MNIKYGIEGFYTLIKYQTDVNREIIAETAEQVADFPNLITNGGLDRFMTVEDFLNYAHVGTGSATPAFTDTALTAFKASSSTAATGDNAGTCASVPPYYAQLVKVKRFAAGVAAGNLTEVGMSWSAATGSLFSRALILDSGGTPTTITLLADEVLDVIYTLRVYIPATDITGTVDGYSYVLRAGYATTYSAGNNAWGMPASYFGLHHQSYCTAYPAASVLAAITAYPSGTAYTATSVSDATYTTGSYTRSGVITWGLTGGNAAGGIGCISYRQNWGAFQLSFSPVVAKTSSKVFAVTVSVSVARL